MNQTQPVAVDQNVIRIISDVAAVAPKDIKPTDRLREDLGMDSVSSMELLSALAEELDLEIEMEEAIDINTVDAVITIVKTKLGIG